MTSEQRDLARRAVACKGWRWMPGMRVVDGSRVVHVREGGDVLLFLGDVGTHEPWEEWRWREDAGIPDLTDPATLGGTRAEFDALTRELAEQRHGRLETYRPVDLVAAARFISLSRSNPGYARWFTLWREIVATRTAQEGA